MCGIFGYVGEPIELGGAMLAALRTLEYRGYDSWGVAVGVDGRLRVAKRTGKIGGATVQFPRSDIGFGHTRWATHGAVSERNAHPHLDCTGELAVIHNGIVENFRDCRAALCERGHAFASETDSEVVAHLIEDELARGAPDLARALASSFARLDGLNAVIALDARRRELVATKSVSPLAVGTGPRGAAIASDALALRGHADRVCYLEDEHLVRLRRDGVTLYDRRTLRELPPAWEPLPAGANDAGLGAHPHFLVKEIAEQPAVLERLVGDGAGPIHALAQAMAAADRTVLLGCGTAAHAALTGAALLGRIAGHRVEAVIASEFDGMAQFLTPRSLVVALSQSGETADVIAAMRAAQAPGARLAALVNVPHSTLDRLVDLRVPLGAGPERSVLATKSYAAMVAALLLAAYEMCGCQVAGAAAVRRAATTMRALLSDPSWDERICAVAATVARAEHLFVVGRGLAHSTALEAALKIKEASYVHAEGLAGGELKHGVIALIEPGTPCLVYAPADSTRADAVSGAMELRSRGAWVAGVGPMSDPAFDAFLPVPDVGDCAPLVHALPAQLLAYHAAVLRGHDPDKPRNLAKSVTVK